MAQTAKDQKPEEILSLLHHSYFKEMPQSVTALPASGSDRQYYRLNGKENSVIGVINQIVKENEAFIKFSTHFRNHELPVPEVFSVSDDKTAYLQTDLGDDTLFSILSGKGLNMEVEDLYINAIKWLPSFQINGIKNLDLSFCFPRRQFDSQSMMWDLNYFKYYFAKLTDIPFDEQLLEDDFRTLVAYLKEAQTGFFMYRDFQSRNIMILDHEPYFIDYQGGRSGPLQYDVASLLYDAKANLPHHFRNELLKIYMETIKHQYPEFNESDFLKYYPAFVLMRILQALGAYGYRGYYQKKTHFLQSVPYALKNLKALFKQSHQLPELPELKKLLLQKPAETYKIKHTPTDLNVRIVSFSYKQGIPADLTGNGGGFVFDCRAMPNPGRLTEYQDKSGLDDVVINYLKEYPEMTAFLESIFNLVDASVKNYIERGFHSLMVSFGCTGGRHRSVYAAEKLAAHLNEKFGLKIEPEHTESERW